ncbi:AMP-binding protein [Nocardia sp. NPDC051832]|uniref:AMP-binding protein n=1 Tax=Nocardia sp. NPDC051832 TaxID=3155673 RepID=UPI00342D94B2
MTAVSTAAAEQGSALHLLAAQRAARTPDAVAMRAKKLGIWQQTSWADLDDERRLIAHGLADLGVGAGDRVAILAGNRPEWVYAELGALSVRALFVGLHPETAGGALEQMLNDAAVRVLIAEDQEQVDKALDTGCPRLRWIVYLEDRGVREYSDPRLLSYAELRERGERQRTAHPELPAAEQSPDAVVALVFPPGGGPEDLAPAHLRGTDVTAVLTALRAAVPDLGGNDVVLPGLSLAEPAERAVTVWTSVICGAVLHFAESYDTLAVDLAEVQPTVRLAPAAGWQRIFSGIENRMSTASRFKRACYRLTSRTADRIAAQRDRGPFARLMFAAGYLASGRALRDKLGLRKTRAAFWSIAIPGTALPHDIPPDPDTAAFFHGLGVPITRVPPARTDASDPTANPDTPA